MHTLDAKRYYDVIIPIYNAYDELVACVESIIKNTTDYENYRLILIDDCSPDQRVRDYIGFLNDKYDHVHALYNESNMGFVSTVNRGMKYSNNDVILLNSDTEVTPRWLSKLDQCAYSSHRIATVTPFTNNGTICSVPLFGQDNDIPEGYSVSSFSEFIEKISFKEYPIIPTAVGFCMLIKRSIIKEIGLFDDVNFNMGYGEENDFCCRVIEHGYINVLADDVFIYHKGSMSFKAEKAELITKNSEVLRKKYPYYFDRVDQFLKANDVFRLVDNIQRRMKTNPTKKNRILYVTHNTIDEDWLFKRGGTEYHVADLSQSLNSQYDIYTLTTNGRRVLLKEFCNGSVLNYNFYLKNPIETHTFYSDEYRILFEKIVNSFEINIVHVHHFQRHTFDLLDVCVKYDIPVLFTAHDYHLICPSILLMDEKGDYCFNKKNEVICQNCLHFKMGYGTNFRETWKQHVEQNLKKMSLIIFPSKSVYEFFSKEYDLISNDIKYTIIEHGIEKYNGTKSHALPEDSFNIAFVGNFAKHKGSNIIADVINKTNSSLGINYFLFGEIHDPIINELKKGNLYKMGQYNRSNITELLNQANIHLVCLLSVVPETFSFTLSEAWSAGIPVLVNDRGALGSRVEEEINGWKVQNLNSNELIQVITNIISDKNNYKIVKDNVMKMQVNEISRMSYEYDMLYKKHINNNSYTYNKNRIRFSNFEIYESINKNNSANQHLERELQLREHELQLIYNTLGWRFINYVKRNEFVSKLAKRALLFLLKLKNR
ncbi:glycosyltransferase [Paenibacillus sp. FSL M7-1455]|uniref:glycosyltransferase n=1 Tax=Paenibacillus sp. FSL M7-1455 TaxID=2975316 RepID=UPI0030FAEE3F